ncbi:MAG: Na+/H+ antiporter NhaC family protein, partial [Victivallales bacterium]|nr:Na+/H+ antiporter NhaC family protein [Victivallales bacterium]
TIMSSAGARCQHINHVSTQLPYAITVALISFISFLISGFVKNWFIVFPIAVIITLGFLFFMKKRMTKAA